MYPAIADMSSTPMNRKAYARIRGPSASGMSTVRMMVNFEAPMARAASMTPGSTGTRFCSTSRDVAKVHMTTIGKMAAAVPMDVPTTLMVSGCIAARKMMNGIGRMMFTITSRM